MKNKRNWSNSEMRSLTRGEAMHHFSKGEHYYVDKDWYIWFLGNATRYAIFHTFLWKYGNGEMVSYTDLTRTEKIGSQRLKIDSIKATIREGLTLGYIEAFKSEKDRRVTMYSFDQSILQEVTDYCFMMRRNRMWESASFISQYSTDSLNKELARAGMKFDWLESINKFVSLFAETAKNAFGQDQLPNVIPIKKGKKRG
ncbi:MAG: hypothetical protein CMD93_01150 [Gammaproteobacteria bacterium]|jgi:hypothetical protein|nr:hypothetical protein [Gammaproteobacteria bacterium]|tara:strand:+ start:2375 stop:2971 length:597 start_codon:yes stop_codon:yes gene_type:complete